MFWVSAYSIQRWLYTWGFSRQYWDCRFCRSTVEPTRIANFITIRYSKKSVDTFWEFIFWKKIVIWNYVSFFLSFSSFLSLFLSFSLSLPPSLSFSFSVFSLSFSRSRSFAFSLSLTLSFFLPLFLSLFLFLSFYFSLSLSSSYSLFLSAVQTHYQKPCHLIIIFKEEFNNRPPLLSFANKYVFSWLVSFNLNLTDSLL